MQKRKRKLGWIVPVAAIALTVCAFFVYVGVYSRADATAEAALVSDAAVSVSRTEYGWFFDGASAETEMVFYPGGKVEAAAYAPLCRLLAENGIDVCLVEMPFRLAFFGANKADAILRETDYAHRYIAGHSLGGVFAAYFAASHAEELDGVVLLASYATEPLDSDLVTILLYGSEDGVLNRQQYEQNRANVPADAKEYVIDGGNHAQFGSYGLQAGDGVARISPQQQIDETVAVIVETILGSDN